MPQSGSDGSIDIEYRDNLAILCMNRGENRVNLDLIEKLNSALDEIERNNEVNCVILTAAGKYFSLGLDLDWLGEKGEEGFRILFPVLFRFVWRLMTFPTLTVAAINGHAYAFGFVLALACDQHVMNIERGWLCMNESRIGLPLNNPFFRTFLRITLPSNQVYRDVGALANKYTGKAAHEVGIVAKVCKRDVLIQTAIDHANTFLNQGPIERDVLRQNKEALNKEIPELLVQMGYLSKL